MAQKFNPDRPAVSEVLYRDLYKPRLVAWTVSEIAKETKRPEPVIGEVLRAWGNDILRRERSSDLVEYAPRDLVKVKRELGHIGQQNNWTPGFGG